jgi:hypothetical protein
VSDDLLGGSVAPGLVSQAEYARIRGISRVSVHEAVQAGKIVLTNGKIDVVSANRAWAANTDSSRRPQDDKSPTLTVSRARKMQADAQVSEMKARQMAGELIDIADARQLWFAAGRTIRERMLALPDAVSGELALSADQAALLRERIAAVLGELPAEAPT